MKKQLTLLVFFLLGTVLYSQTIDTNFNTTDKRKSDLKYTSIELEINTLVNNKTIGDSITVDLIYNGVRRTITGPNNMIVYLRYDIKYFVEISYKDYTHKLLQIDTRHARKDDWRLTAHVYLNKKSSNVEYAGGFAYQDKTFKTFKVQ